MAEAATIGLHKINLLPQLKTREKSLFDVMRDTIPVIKKEDKAKISTQWKLKALDHAVNQISARPEAKTTSYNGTQKDASNEHIIRCAVLRGMRIFQGYPKIESLLPMLEEKAAGMYTSLEENSIYCSTDDIEYPLRGIVTKTTNHPVYVTEDTVKYIGKISPYLKLSQCDLVLYFFCLGIADQGLISEVALNDIKKVIRSINARILEREYEIERFYRYKDNQLYLEHCLEQ